VRLAAVYPAARRDVLRASCLAASSRQACSASFGNRWQPFLSAWCVVARALSRCNSGGIPDQLVAQPQASYRRNLESNHPRKAKLIEVPLVRRAPAECGRYGGRSLPGHRQGVVDHMADTVHVNPPACHTRLPPIPADVPSAEVVQCAVRAFCCGQRRQDNCAALIPSRTNLF